MYIATMVAKVRLSLMCIYDGGSNFVLQVGAIEASKGRLKFKSPFTTSSISTN